MHQRRLAVFARRCDDRNRGRGRRQNGRSRRHGGSTGGFGCNADWFQFRPTDEQLVYQDLSMGIRIDGAGNADPVVPTPPCGDSIMERFGYDAQGTLCYQCSNTLLRGNGQMYTTDIASLSGVLADDRVIVVRPIATPSGGQFQGVAPDGSTASVLDAEGLLGGFFAAPVNATTTAGNDGIVVVSHQADQNVPATESSFSATC